MVSGAQAKMCSGSGKEINVMNDQSPILDRLDNQIDWYDRKSQSAQKRYKLLKLVQVVAAASLPLLPVFGIPHPEKVSAVLGLVILIIETVQQLNQDQQNWIAYRSTCETLKHEKYLFLSDAGPYKDAEKPLALLADRVEGLISQEHAKWVSVQEQAAKDRVAGSRSASLPAEGTSSKRS
jgi:hypothetical protein